MCGVLAIGLYHVDKVNKGLQLEISSIDIEGIERRQVQDRAHIIQLQNALVSTEKKIVGLEKELEFYKKLPISSKDIQLLYKLVSYIKTNVNSELAEKQAVHNVLACLVASRVAEVPLSHVLALVHTESTFRSAAVSSMNCRGLTQVSRRIWNTYSAALQVSMYGIENPFANSVVGASYLKALYRSYSGNYHRALQHYNGGTNFSGATYRFANVVLARASRWDKVIKN